MSAFQGLEGPARASGVSTPAEGGGLQWAGWLKQRSVFSRKWMQSSEDVAPRTPPVPFLRQRQQCQGHHQGGFRAEMGRGRTGWGRSRQREGKKDVLRQREGVDVTTAHGISSPPSPVQPLSTHRQPLTPVATPRDLAPPEILSLDSSIQPLSAPRFQCFWHLPPSCHRIQLALRLSPCTAHPCNCSPENTFTSVPGPVSPDSGNLQPQTSSFRPSFWTWVVHHLLTISEGRVVGEGDRVPRRRDGGEEGEAESE